MARRPRLFVDGAIYHVFCRVGRGELVFQDPEEAGALVKVISEVKRRDGVAIFAWCVMSNHYHVVVRTGRVPLWRTMRLVQGRFAKGYNRRHQVYGSLWQGRYKATVVRDERHLRQVIAYVHMNPVMAGFASDPAQHRMSGHRELVGVEESAGLLDVPEALLAFGESPEAAVRAYVAVLHAVGRARWAVNNPERLPWWRGLRPDRPLTTADSTESPRLDALGGSSERELPPLSVDGFVLAAASALDIGIADLSGPRSGRELTRAREMVAVLGVERYRIRVKDLARQLGRDPSVVSRWVSEAGRRRVSDVAFRERFEQLIAQVRTQATTGSQPQESEFVSGMTEAFVD